MAAVAVAGALDAEVDDLTASAFAVPTDEPESDGTLAWDSTTLVVAEVRAAGQIGLGYTYGDAASAGLIASTLSEVVRGADPFATGAIWKRMRDALRNVGRPGAGAIAVSAVDIALWDLRAKLLGVSLVDALPRFRTQVPIYGSGGFCSYSLDRLREQLRGWAEAGIPRVKMKVGRAPGADASRLEAARDAIGPEVELMVDANGAYARHDAQAWAWRLREEWQVTWLEEPVSSDDTDGLRLLRDHAPPGLAITAGEYGWDLPDFRALLDAGAVDVLQADVTRCGGITGFLAVDALARSHHVPLSAHCAPAVSAHACCAVERLAHLEYFHDHVRVEGLLFDGALDPRSGFLEPDRSRPGLGLDLRRADAERYAL
jgi:L-alanine-DL-glutamate epimerase-like enolase superfamily enzyme